jgi:DNA-binding LacI/PurR family transcriptional regulator
MNGLKQTDGLLFSPEWLAFGDRSLLDNLGFPLVMLGERMFGGSVDHVMMHNVSASRAAVEHLIASGRRRIAVVGGHPDDRTEHLPPADSRVQGYRDALIAADLPLDRRLERAVAPWHPQNGADATRGLLDAGVDFDAIFALTDELALGVLRALGESGRVVPDDVAVIGFDNITVGRFTLPSLSSVDPGRDEIAETAVSMLVERIEGSAPSGRPRIHKAGFHIVVRESTGGTTLRAEETDTRLSGSAQWAPVNGVRRPHTL